MAIQKRNERRSSWKNALAGAFSGKRGSIFKKLEAAARFKTKVRQIGARGDVIYDTKKPMEDTALIKERQALSDFDRQLLEGDDSAYQ